MGEAGGACGETGDGVVVKGGSGTIGADLGGCVGVVVVEVILIVLEVERHRQDGKRGRINRKKIIVMMAEENLLGLLSYFFFMANRAWSE